VTAFVEFVFEVEGLDEAYDKRLQRLKQDAQLLVADAFARASIGV
jgi:hypothetical protein